MKEIVIAADLGGTNLRMAAIDCKGHILHQIKRETPHAERADEIVAALVESAEICRSKVKNEGEIIAISAAVPSGVDYRNGIVVKAPNIPCLDGFRLAAALKNKLNLPVILENDANAAAVGENWTGASKGFQDSIMLTMGTGVGSGIIIDGKILRGIDGMAGEIGHVCIEPSGNPCGCGSRGCVEQYTSATAIVRQTKELESRYRKSPLKNNSRLTSADIYDAGKSGDELALEVFRRMGFYLGIAIGGLVNTFNPEVIVLGGGAAAGWDLFMPHTRNQIAKCAFQKSVERAQIVPAMLGDDAGILGAAKLCFVESRTTAKGVAFN